MYGDLLNMLIDIVGEDETHPLAATLSLVGDLILEQEKRTLTPKAAPLEILVFLMQEHKLTQKDLPEIGSQGVVSEVLNGKREFNLRQIKALSKRFNVSPLVWF